METIIVIMLKNEKTGLFEKEVSSIPILENEDLIINIYAIQNNNNIDIHLKVTTDKDVLDWEYYAIYDHYDINIFKELFSIVVDVLEVEDEYNPTWKIVLRYTDIKSLTDGETLKTHIYNILDSHRKELRDVYEIIKDKKGEYTNEE